MVFLAIVVWLSLSAAAFGHASLVAAEPADGSVVSAAPSQFSLTFSEPVSVLALALIQPDGSSMALTRFLLRDHRLDIEAPVDLAQGTHVLSWRVVSADGHPIAGSVVFSVGAPSTAPPVVTDAVNWPVRLAVWSGRLALYLGLFFGAGGAFAIVWLAGGEAAGRAVVRWMLAIGVLGAVLSVGFQGLDALGQPLQRIADWRVWQAGLSTSFGSTAFAAVSACAIAIPGLALKRLAARLLTLAALAGTGLALALSGHASAAEPQWLTRPMVFLHGTTIAFWTGALIPIGLGLKRRGLAALIALCRFSRVIPFVIAVLICAGVVLALIQVQTPSALLHTAYGRVFLVKLALLVFLFTLAVLNRWVLTKPVRGGDAGARRRLVRAIATETAIAVLIFGVAASWRFTPPPRALAIAAAEPAVTHIHTVKAMADLTLTPGRAGPMSGSIVVMTGDFGPLDAKEVTLVLSNEAAGIEPIRRPARKGGDGTWSIDGLALPVAGKWKVRIDVLVSDFDLARLNGEVEIRP
ncbi:copper resistance CopC/CopD family protein [Pseudaminobacter sp. NGMCC 1.201702]|uniref:copper resistance CopC/CopD family protein n=1 Tax=Pseudaminobacter sp. NGMCC 1.201702 TaxID=3391825 RepID=UPI0039F0EBFE